MSDSGAFSALTKGAKISIERYAEWLLNNRSYIDIAVSLDVIGDHKASSRNFDKLVSLNVKTIPTFHMGSPASALDDCLAQSDFVCFGGLVGKNNVPIQDWLTACFNRVRDHEQRIGRRVYIHGLGVTSVPLLKLFPFYSCDSSSHGSGYRFGYVPIMSSKNLVMRKIGIGNHVDAQKYMKDLLSLGFDRSAILRGVDQRFVWGAIGLVSYKELEQSLFFYGYTRTSLFMADSNFENIAKGFEAATRLNKKCTKWRI